MALERLVKRLAEFDSDFSPLDPVNVEAAIQRGWRYDHEKRAYVDGDGCLRADEYGQDLG